MPSILDDPGKIIIMAGEFAMHLKKKPNNLIKFMDCVVLIDFEFEYESLDFYCLK